MLQPLSSYSAADRFRPLLDELLVLLRGLRPQDWERQTVAPQWRVRDVAAHLLDVDLRKIAVCRDDHSLPMDGPIDDDRDLARFINGLNASGVAYATRLSARLLTDLLELTGGWIATLVESLPPHEPARFAVSWAGESVSENWMDTGRDYTERWHHQAQIRDAVGARRLLEPGWLEPLLDISVRVLPRTYAALDAPPGSTISLVVEGETNGSWTLERGETGWRVLRGRADAPAAIVRVAADDVWRLFYNALPLDEIRARVAIEGDATLAQPLLRARSVIL
jgi:uncharacterized protein (TIGR03083 family)